MRRLVFFGCMLVLVLAAPSAVAQDRPAPGVVWTLPADVRQAERELLDMHAQGVEAVRTAPVRSERLLTLADTLDLQLYQDLPIASLSARALTDTLDEAQRQIEELLTVAQRHPSARHFGLARHSDTSVPSACTYFRQLADHVRQQGPPGSQTYYVTAFVEDDRCADEVDAVLLDARNAAAPYRHIAAWEAVHPEVPAGLGALGTWVRRDGTSGWRVSHSNEAQARYFERHLSHLQADTARGTPPVVFVYRWRDAEDVPGDPYGRAYGLYAEDGSPRPAAEVVAGFFTGEQTTFAFSAGTVSRHATSGIVLLGWGLIGLLSFVYFREPRFRHTLTRYFGAHRFYQEAVAEGREVLVGSSMALLSGSVLGMAAFGIALAHCFRNAQSVVWALDALPASLQPVGAMLLEQPWALGGGLAAGYVASLVLWVVVLVLVGRYRTMVTTRQALMIVGWPRWPMLLVLVAAMVIVSLAPETGQAFASSLITATGGLALWMTGRTIADFTAIAKVPRPLGIATVLASPLVFGLGTALFVIARHDVPVAFLWHLLTRS